MVGFVFFPPSPRHLGLATARDLGQAGEAAAPAKVALTVDADDATLAGIVGRLAAGYSCSCMASETAARLRDIKQANSDCR